MTAAPQIARYADLVPLARSFEINGISIPEGAYARVAAKENILLIEPGNRSTGRGAIQGPPGVEIFLSRCPPGQGPALHLHPQSTEIFHALDGRWEISWGEDGETRVEIGPRDTVSVPPGHYRAFRNISDADATLLVLVAFDHSAGPEATLTAGSVGRQIEAEYGQSVIDAFESVGIAFAR